jgi:hypothetical protein
MAEVLKRKYDLVVFKVTLDTTGEQSRVRCAVEVKIGGEPSVVAEWTSTAAEMGVPERIDRRSSRYRGYQFAIPEEVSSPLRDWVEHEMTASAGIRRPAAERNAKGARRSVVQQRSGGQGTVSDGGVLDGPGQTSARSGSAADNLSRLHR